MTQMNLISKETHRHRNLLVVAKGRMDRSLGLAGATSIYRPDNQQGPTL